MAAGDLYRLQQRVVYQQVASDGQPGVLLDNVFHFQARDGGASLLGLAEDWRDSVMQDWRTQCYQGFLFARLYAYSLIPDGPPPVALQPMQRGTATALDFLVAPLCCAAVVQWNLSHTSPYERGRTYLRGMPYNNVPTSWFNSPGLGARMLGSSIATRYGVGSPGSYQLVVWSPTIGGRQPPYNPLGATPVDAWDWLGTIAVTSKRRSSRAVDRPPSQW